MTFASAGERTTEYLERVAIFSHSSPNCNMLCWAVACYLDKAELVFYNDEDQRCPDCGSHGTIGSSPSVKAGFSGDIFPKPSSPLIIREASGHQWQHHIPA